MDHKHSRFFRAGVKPLVTSYAVLSSIMGGDGLNIENSVLPVGVVYLICRYPLVPCFVVSVFIHYPDSGYRVFEDDSIRGKQRYFN